MPIAPQQEYTNKAAGITTSTPNGGEVLGVTYPKDNDPLSPNIPKKITDNRKHTKGTDDSIQVTAGIPTRDDQVGIADLTGQLVTDPSLLISGETSLEDQRDPITGKKVAKGLIAAGKNKYKLDADGVAIDPDTVDSTAQVNAVDPTASGETQTALALEEMEAATVDEAQGQLSQNALVDTTGVELDTEAIGQGLTETGKALNDYASQNIANVIDTSTLSGRQLAEQLGEGNYTDSKATLKGQLDILQNEFTDSQGNPTIPAWAAATARSVSKMIAFDGVSGTAAMAAVSQAMLEASLPIAQQDAAFFQTVSLKNLDNKQQSIINKANVLSKIDLANMDTRMTAAVTNANNFMQMDMANLSNEQQARVIEGQGRIQAILEDANQENVTRRFNVENENEMNKFYDSLNTQIEQYNATETNSMEQYNTSQVNAAKQFNAQMEDSREKYYIDNQFRIDQANAEWRQEVVVLNQQQKFEAQATDVRNMVGISVESMNQLWDRSDQLLNYAWQSAENEADRQATIALEKVKAHNASDLQDQTASGEFLGTLIAFGLDFIF